MPTLSESCVKGGYWNLNDTCCNYRKIYDRYDAEYKITTNT